MVIIMRSSTRKLIEQHPGLGVSTEEITAWEQTYDDEALLCGDDFYGFVLGYRTGRVYCPEDRLVDSRIRHTNARSSIEEL